MSFTPLNPNPERMKQFKSQPSPDISKCPYCGSQVIQIVSHDDHYGRTYGEWPWLYKCFGCDATVGMHPGTNVPLGTLADDGTKFARKYCKTSFQKIWKEGYMSRGYAYRWLAEQLGITQQECHFGLFNIEQCQRAKLVCDSYLKAVAKVDEKLPF